MGEWILGRQVREYIDRVVNARDLTAVDDLVSADYRGSGPDWPTTLDALRQFYLDQYRERPDWHIDVQDSIELGCDVVVRAVAGGAVQIEGVRRIRRLEWLTHYRWRDGLICEINVLAVEQRGLT
jgi:SnoaL-like domain